MLEHTIPDDTARRRKLNAERQEALYAHRELFEDKPCQPSDINILTGKRMPMPEWNERSAPHGNSYLLFQHRLLAAELRRPSENPPGNIFAALNSYLQRDVFAGVTNAAMFDDILGNEIAKDRLDFAVNSSLDSHIFTDEIKNYGSQKLEPYYPYYPKESITPPPKADYN